jgi:hypothetical protein
MTATTEHFTFQHLGEDLEFAHRRAVAAATARLQGAATLGSIRLTGSALPEVADAAVSSATPLLRAPLLNRIARVLALHTVPVAPGTLCPTCGVPAPCPTVVELDL